MREIIARAGCAVVPLPSVENAITLLAHKASCDLVVLAVDVLNGDAGLYDRLLSARTPRPDVIMYGVDSGSRLVLHGLNSGAADFLAKPVADEELIRAVENLAFKDRDVSKASSDVRAIYASSHITGWIELTAASELEQFRRLQRFSDALFEARLPHNVRDDLKMAVEEVGRNAMEWGNHFDPDKRVHISYCLFDDRIVIKVEDEGEGFVPANVPDPTVNPLQTMRDRASAGKRPGGYGVFLIQKLMDDIFYSEKGNSVILVKYLPQKTDGDAGVEG